MQIPLDSLSTIILGQLAGGEMRLLTLLVGVRKSLNGAPVKGDLSSRVQTALRALVASKAVVVTDGVYGLPAATTAH